jgi:hypothetical protein
VDATDRALHLLVVGRWREVVDLLAEDRDGPAAGRAWELTSRALLLGGDVRAAVDAAGRAVAAEPGSASAHDCLARALLADDRPRRAAAAVRRAAELAPDDWTVMVLASQVLTATGLAGTGAWYARRSVELAPLEAETHVAVARCYWTSNPDTTLRALREALRLDPLHVDARRLLGHLDLARDRIEAGASEIGRTAGRSDHLLATDFAHVGGTWLTRVTAVTCVLAVATVIVVYSLPGFGSRPMWALLLAPGSALVLAAVTAWRLDRRLRGRFRVAVTTALRSWSLRMPAALLVALLLATTVAGLAPDGGVRRVAATAALVAMVVAGVGTWLVSWAAVAWRAVRRAVRDR